MNRTRLLQKILAGSKNIHFDEMTALVQAFGFHLTRIKGSHHIFTHPQVPELINLQEVKGKVKPYQVQQFLNLVEKYDLKLEEEA